MKLIFTKKEYIKFIQAHKQCLDWRLLYLNNFRMFDIVHCKDCLIHYMGRVKHPILLMISPHRQFIFASLLNDDFVELEVIVNDIYLVTVTELINEYYP